MSKKFIIIGDVYTDYHTDFDKNELRLGGVFHSARAFDALTTEYFLGVFFSSYQKKSIENFAEILHCKSIIYLGLYTGKPNVILIGDSRETGNQYIGDVLRLENEVEYSMEKLKDFLVENRITDALIYPGSYNLSLILNILKEENINIHIDVQYDKCNSLENIETVIVSTSSPYFLGFEEYINQFEKQNIKYLLLKENRGGSRLYSFTNKAIIASPAFKIDTIHSVGVGDVYNSVLLSFSLLNQSSLEQASMIAALYASTLNHNTFVEKCKKILNQEMELIPYPIVPWEKRSKFKIYLASPDFPGSITRQIAESIEKKLKYHNFSLTRPIIKNGLTHDQSTESERRIAYYKDMQDIHDSSLCIALLDEPDTGTAAEIGIFKSKDIPIIGYYTKKKCLNNFVYASLNYITDDMNELIEFIYQHYGESDE